MSKKTTQTYTQCILHRDLGGGSTSIQTAWIPSEFAQVNKHIALRLEDRSWQSGWIVVSKGSTKSAKRVEADERDYLKQREASDI